MFLLLFIGNKLGLYWIKGYNGDVSAVGADQNTAVSQRGALNGQRRSCGGFIFFFCKATIWNKGRNVAEKSKGFIWVFHQSFCLVELRMQINSAKMTSIPLKTKYETFSGPPTLKSLIFLGGGIKNTQTGGKKALNKIRRPALRGRICQEVLAACLLSSAIFIAKSKCWRHPMWKRRGPGCPGLSQVAAIVFSVGGHKKKRLGSFYTNQNPRGKKKNTKQQQQKKKRSQCKSRDFFPASFPPPHPAIRAIMHTHCHKSNALSWSVGAEYIKRVCRICIQTYLF